MKIISAKEAYYKANEVNNNNINVDNFKQYLKESINNVITSASEKGLYSYELFIPGEEWEKLKIVDDVAIGILHDIEVTLDDSGYTTNLEFKSSYNVKGVKCGHIPWSAIFTISWKTLNRPHHK